MTDVESINRSLRRNNYIFILSKLYSLEIISKSAYVGELIHIARAEGYNLDGIVIKEEFDDRK